MSTAMSGQTTICRESFSTLIASKGLLPGMSPAMSGQTAICRESFPHSSQTKALSRMSPAISGQTTICRELSTLIANKGLLPRILFHTHRKQRASPRYESGDSGQTITCREFHTHAAKGSPHESGDEWSDCICRELSHSSQTKASPRYESGDSGQPPLVENPFPHYSQRASPGMSPAKVVNTLVENPFPHSSQAKGFSLQSLRDEWSDSICRELFPHSSQTKASPRRVGDSGQTTTCRESFPHYANKGLPRKSPAKVVRLT
ncbi:hypothetical protein AVEN_107260-1 [Araneus ventricosus]|uniref:Uncharacterized protein n=1 Tax=Araneus ventricosus TaxID=182803 RepID=A0A4Y2SWV9_ARAVE|nr:hypothetical protein AVEN_107260-1 [Araneus ventricosus]